MTAPSSKPSYLASPPPRVGVSACLLGQAVRVNGGHCRDRWLTDVLGPHVDWVSVCPEVEMGMGSPRPPMRLVAGADAPRLVMTEGGEDRTAEMDAWSAGRLDALADDDLHGYVLKKGSPTCGVFRVRVYDRHGVPSRTGRGQFARRLAERFPSLPIEEEGRLNDAVLRENFVLRVFTYARWQHFLAADGTAAGLVGFHAAHKLLVLAHAPDLYPLLGRLVAGAGTGDRAALFGEYGRLLMEALARRATRGRHVNTMQHLIGFVKDDLDAEDKRELERVLAEYRKGLVALAVPLTLIRHLLRRHAPDSWAAGQVYLAPYPAELMLRNAP
jgi:uncharacterized protein YbgA (DUF1722 family)/uncharacterized protein YbbK (DUF523 family)